MILNEENESVLHLARLQPKHTDPDGKEENGGLDVEAPTGRGVSTSFLSPLQNLNPLKRKFKKMLS